jgi:hypothetical protein
MKHIKRKTIHMKRVEQRIKEPLEEALRRKFVDENKPIHTIKDELGASYDATVKWLKMSGVYSRKLRIQR